MHFKHNTNNDTTINSALSTKNIVFCVMTLMQQRVDICTYIHIYDVCLYECMYGCIVGIGVIL